MNQVVMLIASILALATSFSAPGGAAGSDDPPPIFDKRPYNEAKKSAEDAKKLFIVKATAAWCMPCKQMDKTTWRDEKVVNWVEKNAIASVFDVDKDTSLATQLGIRAMPTMIAFKDGKEFDRVVGYKSPDEFLVWLEGIARGERSIEVERRRAGDRGGDGGKVDVEARMNLARTLDRSGKSDEAADEYAWLWQHMLEHNRAYYGVRLSFMAGDMERLASRDDGAKRRFTQLRDALTKFIEGDAVDRDDLVDWVVLNRIVGDAKSTLGWYDRVKEQGRWRGLIERVSRDLQPLLLAEKRWADIGRLRRDAVEDLEREHEILAMTPKHDLPPDLPEATRKQIEDMPSRMFRDKARYPYAGLLAAGREEDANALATKARGYDPSPAMILALVSTAMEAGQPRVCHLEWLAEAGDSDDVTRLRGAVKAGLDKTK